MDETGPCLSCFLLEGDGLVSRVISRFPFAQAMAVSDGISEVPEWLIEEKWEIGFSWDEKFDNIH